MAIASTFSALVAELKVGIAASAVAQGIQNLQIYQDQTAKSSNDSPPRIVFLLKGESYDGALKAKGSYPQKSYRTVTISVDVHIHGPDLGTTEALRNILIIQAMNADRGSTQFASGSWKLPDYETFGYLLIVTLSFDIPVVDVANTTQTITSIASDTTTALFGDGVLQCGETS